MRGYANPGHSTPSHFTYTWTHIHTQSQSNTHKAQVSCAVDRSPFPIHTHAFAVTHKRAREARQARASVRVTYTCPHTHARVSLLCVPCCAGRAAAARVLGTALVQKIKDTLVSFACTEMLNITAKILFETPAGTLASVVYE